MYQRKECYQVWLSAEDGDYQLSDTFVSYENAERYASGRAPSYGEGQHVYIRSIHR